MKQIAAAFLLLLAGQLSAAVERRDPDTHFFDQTFGDFSEELSSAREQGKKGILIMFEMEECPFCHRMRTQVLNRKDVQEYFRRHFLIFSVDIEGDIEITDFRGRPTTMKEFAFRQFRVRATPVFQFIDLEGRPIRRGRYTGATRDAEEFLLLGRYIVEEAWRKMSFSRYKREMRTR
ncbi:MAG TPA: thioredoxin [Thiolapillus brandeum]|uniref:Thioredoxin n=1 Tax=Thiolapillus brandeum TaxID=1076588 RepID=A0A7C5N3Q8_9GAMM|nr:thioredoxin [Thiolapillus brandeum]